MRLLDWMKAQGLDDVAMAEKVGSPATPSMIKKAKYGETIPRLPILLRIQDVTGGVVTPADFVKPAEKVA